MLLMAKNETTESAQRQRSYVGVSLGEGRSTPDCGGFGGVNPGKIFEILHAVWRVLALLRPPKAECEA
jgi:hypothetical protein